MANEQHLDTRDPDRSADARWSGWFLVYLGLGLGLTATAILAGRRAAALAVILYVFAAASLAAGIKWTWLEPRLTRSFSGSVARIAKDFRYWLLLLLLLILFNLLPSISASLPRSAETPPGSKPLLLKPTLDWEASGPIRFTAQFQRSGMKLGVYVDWGAAYGGGGSIDLLGGSGVFLPSPRVKIGFVDSFVVGQELDVVLAIVSKGKSYEGMMLQWGDGTYDNAKVNVTWGTYMGKVILVEQDLREEAYPFLVIARSRKNAEGNATPLPPLVIGPSFLKWIATTPRGSYPENP